MEAIEEPPHFNTTSEGVKATVFEQPSEQSGVALETDIISHKTNGVVESADASHSATSESLITQDVTEKVVSEEVNPGHEFTSLDIDAAVPSAQSSAPSMELVIEEVPDEVTEEVVTDVIENVVNEDILADDKQAAREESSEHTDSVPVEAIVESQENECIIQSNDVEVSSERVTFETEILVESNTNEITENESKTEEDSDPNTNILSELGPNIELSEALRSSDVADAVENNNCTPKQEMFNKEELLDILEGDLITRKCGDNFDGYPLLVGIYSMLRQTKTDNTDTFIDFLCSYSKIKSDLINDGAHIVRILEMFCEAFNYSFDKLEDKLPLVLLTHSLPK